MTGICIVRIVVTGLQLSSKPWNIRRLAFEMANAFGLMVIWVLLLLIQLDRKMDFITSESSAARMVTTVRWVYLALWWILGFFGVGCISADFIDFEKILSANGEFRKDSLPTDTETGSDQSSEPESTKKDIHQEVKIS